MKVAIIILSLLCVGYSAPQPRKVFHEHMEEFLDIIMEDIHNLMEDIHDLMEHYIEFEEFWAGVYYLGTNNFRDLVAEMESLPEFTKVVDFLENDNIDILYFIDRFHEMLDNIAKGKRERHELSGKDLSAFITDITSQFPKEKLAALYDQKMNEDEEFRTAMENLYSDEWKAIFGALFENEVFQKEIKTLEEHGIKVDVIINEIVAVFGQN